MTIAQVLEQNLIPPPIHVPTEEEQVLIKAFSEFDE